MNQEGISLFEVRDDVRCVKCGNKGAVQHYGKYYPNGLGEEPKSKRLEKYKDSPYMSHAMGFGGTIPHRCLNCRNVGLIDFGGLEGYTQAFVTIKDDVKKLKKHYVVGMIFDKSMNHVLMLFRNKQPYAKLYNGVGGKVENGEKPLQAMIRELEEETGMTTENVSKPYYLTTLLLPEDITLEVFYMVYEKNIERSHVWKETSEGTLEWLNIQDYQLLDVSQPQMAGDGNIAYFIEYARRTENKKRGDK